MLYRVHTSFTDEAITKLSKISRICRFICLKESKKHTNNEHDAFNIGSAASVLTNLELDEKLQMATLETLEPRLRSAINIFSRLKWAFSDHEKVQNLISTLQEYNRNMKALVDGHNDKVGMTAVVGMAAKNLPHFMVPFPKNEEFIGESLIASRFKPIKQSV
ncbi:hypothetical protein FPQ18DRAFT_113763 [Pyronema domesticum]|nr:hypothetical protein FPQ18DRAFT_113763 [Pyronema domesticum]